MIRGLTIVVYFLAAALAVTVLLTGCGGLPSMRYCDKVEYRRDGNKIDVHAECRAAVGGVML